MTDLQKDVAAYIAELNTDSVVSRSHRTLRWGRIKWGASTFDAEVDRQLAEKGGNND